MMQFNPTAVVSLVANAPVIIINEVSQLALIFNFPINSIIALSLI